MTFHDVIQRDGLVFTATDAFQRAFCQIHVLEILQVFEDSFTDIVSFGAPGAPGQLLKSFFNGLRQSNSQHKRSEERRVGKECRSREGTENEKKYREEELV